MVSRKRDAARSRERLLAAAAAEFAANGFAGAKVDRISAKARLNKAMIYYHFGSKAALYREVLLDVFGTVADAVATDVTAAAPADQIRQFVRVVAGVVASRPHFGPIWLREMAEGGTHVDVLVLEALQRILPVLQRIISDGAAAGVFRPTHPLIVQLGIVGPLLMFAASAPARRRFTPKLGALAQPPVEALLAHIEASALGALSFEAAEPAASRVPRRDSRRRRS